MTGKRKPSLNVVPFKGQEPCEFTVDLLTDLLDKARSGELRGVCLVAFTTGGGVAGSYSPEMLQDCYAAVGALEGLKYQMLDEMSYPDDGDAS